MKHVALTLIPGAWASVATVGPTKTAIAADPLHPTHATHDALYIRG